MVDPVNDLRRLAWRALARTPRPVRELASLPVRRRADAQLRALAPMPSGSRRLYVGPWNTAGQAWEWARAAERHLPDVAAQNLWAQRSLSQSHFHYRADHELSVLAQRGRVREIHGERVLREATHVLFESGRPVLSDFHAGSMLDDLPALKSAGICPAVLYHGSEIRDLREHADRYPHSPFRVPERDWDDYFRTLQGIVERNRRDLDHWVEQGLEVFVSTPDLLDMVPGARLLPLVVDVERFAAAALAGGVRPLERDRPVVLHAPSNPRLKGGTIVKEQMEQLDRRRVIEYRPLGSLHHADMAASIADADIVLDQFALGATGVFAAEAQAAGRIVVAHVAPPVREVLAAVDDRPLPVVESAPHHVGHVVESILSRADYYRTLAADAQAWARRHHDGRRSAQVLDDWLGPARG